MSRRRPRWWHRFALAITVLTCTVAAVIFLRPVINTSSSGSRASQPVTESEPGAHANVDHRPGFQLNLNGKQLLRVAFHVPPRAGLLFNLDSGQVLWSRNPTRQLSIASLTKMMTALLVARNSDPHDRVKITRQALSYTGSGIGVLPKHRRVQLEALLNGLLLVSGNDAAIALAQHVAGSVPAFVHLMNGQARRMHLTCTHFVSPHGVEDANRSCASDLAALAHADLGKRRIARIARRKSANPKVPIRSGHIWLYNNNPLIRLDYPGITGLKTGLTSKAGHCIVATAKQHGLRLGVVLLHSPNLYLQGRRLLNAGFRYETRRGAQGG